jgi:hypothetical protein
MHYTFRFVLATLAVWRVTHLVAREDGPWDLVLRLRRGLGAGMLARLVACFYCLSLWVALPFAWFLKGETVETFVGWLALSGGASLLERLGRQSLELKVEEAEPWDVAAKR